MNPDLQNTVTLETAKEWTTAWREKYQNPKKPEVNPCNAFLMPAVDLIEVLNEMGLLSDKVAKKAQEKACLKGKKVRAYMAIGNDSPDETTEEKLLVVGTKYNRKKRVYQDIINEEIDGDEVKLNFFGDPIISSGIYDFTDPCPPSCDIESPLN
ncbi:hypothetical protein SAMN04487910_0154 [Aquimarina amphilecti]|uniref:Uncharacterized protein n=1 Tax=Aquimarina amphilecti TaxID=1038014 RepID=A0A1H7FSG2_AQUAM|nr:hypothetical protein [Aquimarina amphilecti]SEK28157.1 hypothetical protein SAMN04487910_0154 [Aquimarina amphilecti]